VLVAQEVAAQVLFGAHFLAGTQEIEVVVADIPADDTELELVAVLVPIRLGAQAERARTGVRTLRLDSEQRRFGNRVKLTDVAHHCAEGSAELGIAADQGHESQGERRDGAASSAACPPAFSGSFQAWATAQGTPKQTAKIDRRQVKRMARGTSRGAPTSKTEVGALGACRLADRDEAGMALLNCPWAGRSGTLPWRAGP